MQRTTAAGEDTSLCLSVSSWPQMAPINAEDYGSGDLDKHFARMTSLRIDTSKPTGMASRALEALGIADDDILKDADDGGKEDLFEVRRLAFRPP